MLKCVCEHTVTHTHMKLAGQPIEPQLGIHDGRKSKF